MGSLAADPELVAEGLEDDDWVPFISLLLVSLTVVGERLPSLKE